MSEGACGRSSRYCGTGACTPPRAAAGTANRITLRSERGTALIEFALVAPLLFLLLLGILDFSRGLSYYSDVTQLAAEGARAAAVDRNPLDVGDPRAASCPTNPDTTLPPNTPYQDSIQCQLWNSAISPELKGIAPGPNNSPPLAACVTVVPTQTGENVTVTASKTLNLFPLLNIGALQLSGSTTMRAEVVPSGGVQYSPGCFSG